MKTLNQIIEKLQKRPHYYYPGMDIQLYKQEPLSTYEAIKMRARKPQNMDEPGESLLKRDKKREPYKVLRNFLPRRAESPRKRTALEDIKNFEHFNEWFSDKYGDQLEPGIYCSFKGAGRGNGFSWFMVFEFRNGQIQEWRKKSNGTIRANPSTYYTFPWYFKERQKHMV